MHLQNRGGGDAVTLADDVTGLVLGSLTGELVKVEFPPHLYLEAGFWRSCPKSLEIQAVLGHDFK